MWVGGFVLLLRERWLAIFSVHVLVEEEVEGAVFCIAFASAFGGAVCFAVVCFYSCV